MEKEKRQVSGGSSSDLVGDNTLGGSLGDKNSSSSSSSSGGGDSSSTSGGGTSTSPGAGPTEKEFRGNSLDSMLAMFGSNDNGNSYIDSSGTIYYKDKNPKQTDQRYFDSALSVTDPTHASAFMDKAGRLSKERTVAPMPYIDTLYSNKKSRVFTDNRQELVNEYNLRIGDSVFVIPPEYIQVNNTSHTKIQTALRQTSSFKTKTGHSNREILLTLYFNGVEQVNGTEIPSPFNYNYSMDGLLSLVAQFKCTPFLPIQNEYLNLNFNIFSVALQSMSVSTVNGFPGCLAVTLIMQEFYSTPYTMAHNMTYDEMIDWDLFRYYYQRYIHRNLGKVDKDNLNGQFKFSVLDKQKLLENPQINLKDNKNYYDILDSVKNVELVDMSFTLNNILANLQMQEHPMPTVQFLGGSDVYFNMTFETTDNAVVKMFNDVADITQLMTRELTDFQGIGFIKIENEITKLLGINNFMLNSLQINTVPEFPGLSVINVECISYELGTVKDVLKGMRPFEGDREGTEKDLISKKIYGAYNKAHQDNTIERKMMKLELYPDLQLPKYDEVDEAIKLINGFKHKNGMKILSYGKYPRPHTYSPGKGDVGTYSEYVDPDFYFFYSTKWQDITYDKFKKATSEGGRVDSNKDGKDDIIVEGNTKTQTKPKTEQPKKPKSVRSALAMALKTDTKDKDKDLDKTKGTSFFVPYSQAITPSTVIARQYAVGEDDEEYQKAWRAGNYKYERTGGFSGDGSSGGGASGNLNVQGMGNLKNVTGNALCDLAISRKDVSWYVWGAEGQEITTEMLNKMSKTFGSGNYRPVVWDKANKGLTGYDCAGLIRWCLKQLGVKPSSYSCTSGAMYQSVDQKISKSQLQPGDLLWHSGHVAIYAGGDNTIEAMSSDRGVLIGKVGNRFKGFGRFNNVPSTQEVLAKMGGSTGSSGEEPSQSKANSPHYGDKDNSTTQIKPNTPGQPNNRRRTLRNEYITVDTPTFKLTPTVKAPAPTKPTTKAPTNNGTTGNTSSNNNSSSSGGTSSGGGFSNGIPNLNHPDANRDWGHGVQASTLDAHFKGKLAGSGAFFVAYGNIYKVNPGLCAAIASFETGNGVSSQVNKYNNPGGLRGEGDKGSYTGSHGKFAIFSCIQEGIRAKVSLVSRKYVGEGLRTIPQIGAKYCPPSDPQDHEGNNSSWPNQVSNRFRQIMGYDYDPSKSGTGVKNEMLEPATGGWDGGGSASGATGGGGGWNGPLIGNYVAPPPAPTRTPNKNAGEIYCRKIVPMYGDNKTLESMIGKVTVEDVGKYKFPDTTKKDDKKPTDNKPTGDKPTQDKPTKMSFRTNKPIPRTPTAPEDVDINAKPEDRDKPRHSVKELNAFGRPIFMYSPLNSAMVDAIDKDITSGKYMGQVNKEPEWADKVDKDKVNEWVSGNGSISGDDKKDKDKDMSSASPRKKVNTRTNADGNSGSSGTTTTDKDNSKFESPITNEGEKNFYKMCSYGDISDMTPSLMCVDMDTYSHNGRMTRAFPTFLFMMLDDGGDWVDGRKLWSNYYAYKPVVDIRIHQDYSQPVHTAAITLSNIYGALETKEGVNDKKDFGDEKGILAWIYRKTGLMLCAPKITENAINLKNNIYDTVNLKPGARIHLRMGYGSNPLMLPICFNGIVAEIENRPESTFFIAQSDGAELINDVVSTKQDQCNNMIKYGSEPSNVIGSILVERDSKWMNIINEKWGEASKFGIEHFGIHLGYNRDDADAKEYDLLKNIYLGLYRMTRLSEGEWRTAFQQIKKKNVLNLMQDGMTTIGNMLNGNNTNGTQDGNNSGGTTGGTGGNTNQPSNPNNPSTPRTPIKPTPREPIDPSTPGDPGTSNIPGSATNNNTNNNNGNANGNQVENGLPEMDENNINVFLFNKTPWDCFKMFEQSVPEFICQPGYHQFESRLFFGMPHYLFSYRYDISNGGDSQLKDGETIYEAAKCYSQFHYLDGLDNIIDNSMKASNKDLYNNCVVTYSLGGEMESTPTVYSDRSIAKEAQRTKIVDSSINQDYFGLDKFYQVVGLAVGKNAAINTAISCLLDSWKKSYKGTITTIGDASIKPCDYIYINDNISQIYGMCTVREVIHEFSMSTGFTSVITPGLIGTTTLKNSGMNNVVRSMITLGSSFAANYYIRTVGIKTIQHFITSLSISKTAKIYLNSKLNGHKVDKDALIYIAKHYDEVIDLVRSGKAIDHVADIAKGAKNMYKVLDTVKDVKTLKNAISTIKLAATASGSAVPVIGNIIMYIISSLLLDWILNGIIEEFMYNNSVNVYPVMMKGKPLLAGAKGFTKLVPGLGESAIEFDDKGPDKEEMAELEQDTQNPTQPNPTQPNN